MTSVPEALGLAADRPATMPGPQNPDSPAAFLNSWEGIQSRALSPEVLRKRTSCFSICSGKMPDRKFDLAVGKLSPFLNH
jgi:hypothetical protein